MEPNKFEENIREKLQEREIQPSNDSWEKLNARLGKPEKKKSYFIWYAVAASLVSILVIGSLFFNKTDEVSNSENLVETPINKEIIDSKNQPERIQESIISEDIAVEGTNKSDKTKAQKVESNQISKRNSNQKQKLEVFSAKEKDNAIAKMETTNKDEPIPKKETVEKSKDQFLNDKVNEVVAQVKEIQNKNNTVTAEEVDALLAHAQRDIKTRQILNPETQKVDAAALLLDVELELERSFREKVFDALGDGFNKIRTAVVERNN